TLALRVDGSYHSPFIRTRRDIPYEPVATSPGSTTCGQIVLPDHPTRIVSGGRTGRAPVDRGRCQFFLRASARVGAHSRCFAELGILTTCAIASAGRLESSLGSSLCSPPP